MAICNSGEKLEATGIRRGRVYLITKTAEWSEYTMH